MSLPYTNNKPEAADKLKNSQPVIRENFNSIKSFLEVDHKAFADATSGKHSQVTLPRLAAPPAAGVNELTLYTKEVSGRTELFYKRDNDATEHKISSTGGSAGANHWTNLPNGMIAKWGEASISGHGTLALGTPALATRYVTQVTPLASTVGATIDTDISVIAIHEPSFATNSNNMRVFCSNRAGSAKVVWFNYFVIGTKA